MSKRAKVTTPSESASVSALALASSSTSTKMDDNQRYVSINGRVIDDITTDATISIFDTSILRGDGVFEVMKIVVPTETDGPSPYIPCLTSHLQRLQTSATVMGCPLPDIGLVRTWLEEAVKACRPHHGALRLIATKGEEPVAVSSSSSSSSSYTVAPPSVIISSMPRSVWPATFTLLPMVAPWHPAGFPGWENPIKWTSYGPNVLSTDRAKKAGFTDALLLSPHRVILRSRSGANNDTESGNNKNNYFNDWNDVPLQDYHVLDGPNFAVAWIQERPANDDDGENTSSKNNNTPILRMPCSKTLGLLPSTSQARVAELARTELGWDVEWGVYTFGQLLDTADEVIVMSTTRGVKAVTKIGDHDIVSSRIGMGGEVETLSSRATQLALLLERNNIEMVASGAP